MKTQQKRCSRKMQHIVCVWTREGRHFSLFYTDSVPSCLDWMLDALCASHPNIIRPKPTMWFWFRMYGTHECPVDVSLLSGPPRGKKTLCSHRAEGGDTEREHQYRASRKLCFARYSLLHFGFFLLPAVLLMFLYLQHSEKQRNILPNSVDILTGPHKVRGAM